MHNIKTDVKSGQTQIKKNIAAGSDMIGIEMLTVLDDSDINKVTKMLSKIYDSSEILEALSKSIFIFLLKKTGANKWKLH